MTQDEELAHLRELLAAEKSRVAALEAEAKEAKGILEDMSIGAEGTLLMVVIRAREVLEGFQEMTGQQRPTE